MIKFKRIGEHTLPLPSYETEDAAGMDIRSAEYIEMLPRSMAVVATGWAVEIPRGYELQVRPRSGLAAKHGVTVLNTPGTIDSDYRGEIKVILINHGPDVFAIFPGDRIAQLVLGMALRHQVVEVEELSDTKRGEGGLGSTGVA